jgi:hypothetical protein
MSTAGVRLWCDVTDRAGQTSAATDHFEIRTPARELLRLDRLEIAAAYSGPLLPVQTDTQHAVMGSHCTEPRER